MSISPTANNKTDVKLSSERERFFGYMLLAVEDITPRIIGKLLEIYSTPEEAVIKAKDCRLLSDKLKNTFWKMSSETAIWRIKYDDLIKKGVRVVFSSDPDYPSRLDCVPDKPFGLFVKGSLPPEDRKSVAIVGARRATPHGKWIAGRIAGDLAAAGVTVISGMAEGIDASSHEGALSCGGRTAAVLGTGVNVCFPASSRAIYEKMCRTGAVISEYEPDSAGKPYHFPIRNRIISGLSDAVVVVEAKERSGSLITVDHALSQGKDVLAVPGRPDDPCSAACNKLIKEGAGCCTAAADVLELLGVGDRKTGILAPGADGQKQSRPAPASAGMNKTETEVLSAITGKTLNIDEISELTGLFAGEVLGALAGLEISGMAQCISDGFYTASKS